MVKQLNPFNMSNFTLRFFIEDTPLDVLTTKKEYSRSPNHMTLRRLANELGADSVEVYKSDRYANNTEFVKSIAFDF